MFNEFKLFVQWTNEDFCTPVQTISIKEETIAVFIIYTYVVFIIYIICSTRRRFAFWYVCYSSSVSSCCCICIATASNRRKLLWYAKGTLTDWGMLLSISWSSVISIMPCKTFWLIFEPSHSSPVIYSVRYIFHKNVKKILALRLDRL